MFMDLSERVVTLQNCPAKSSSYREQIPTPSKRHRFYVVYNLMYFTFVSLLSLVSNSSQ